MKRKIKAKNNYFCESIKALHDLAGELLQSRSTQHCYLLVGNLGSGKTEWTNGACKSLDIQESSSPSFSLQNVYESKKLNIKIYHFDLYRLETEEEIVTSGLWDAFDNSNSIIIIEWADRILMSDIPLDWPVSLLEFDGKRNLSVTEFENSK